MRLPLQADVPGRLVRRYKRFLADVETEDGRVLTVHCPNPGSMRGMNAPGSAVRCQSHDDPRRKLRHSLEMIRVGRVWVGTNTARANQLAERILAAGALPALAGYGSLRREVTLPDALRDPEETVRTRLDFALDDHPSDPRPAYVEVKSVTLAEGRCARFPDSVTTRGRRHMQTLERLARRGVRAALLFVVQRGDCDRVEPADDIDPDYAEALRRAARAGVEVHAVGTRVGARGIALERVLPVVL
ncbi:MAG: DNA/RNA nuclease SfsA [Myxococcota bacterium]